MQTLHDPKSNIFKPTSSRLLRAGLLVPLALALVLGTGTATAKRGGRAAATCPPSNSSALGAAAGTSSFKIPMPGTVSSVWDEDTIGLTIPIENELSQTAFDVRVTDVKVSNAVTEGSGIQILLGDLEQAAIGQVNVRIRDRDGHLNGKYRLIVRGHYKLPGGRACSFAVKDFFSPSVRSDDETFVGVPGEMLVQDPVSAEYPEPQDTTFDEFNAETPILVPPGPPRELFEPTPTPSDTQVPAGAALDVNQNRNSTSNNAGTPPDPNAARGTDGVVLATYNTGISFSTDGGGSFTDVNLFGPVAGRPSFFPQSDAGLCCDQVVIYVPSRNLFVWLLQYTPVSTTSPAPGGGTTTTITQPNRQRIAWATPQAIIDDFFNAWTYGDLTATSVPGVSSGLGAAANEWLDYPDLAYSEDFLYVGTDRGFPDSPGGVYRGRRIVARLNLDDMADPASTVVRYDFTEYSGSNGLNKTHFVQGVPDRMVVASLDDTSTLRIYTWEDDAGSAYVRTVGISSITTSYTAPAPDGTDWYANSFPANITGGTYRDGDYLFAFNGGVDAPARPRAYVRLETVTPMEILGIPLLFVTEEYDIWNSDYAFAMGVLGTQGGEIGIGLAVGGGTIGFPQFAVGFKDDFFVQIVTSSNAVQGGRFGDYLSVRPIPGSSRFAAEFYDTLSTPAGGARAVARYVEFGRPIQVPF